MDKAKLYEAIDVIGMYMDNEELLTNLVMALDSDTLESVLAFISRQHDLNHEPLLNELKEK